MTFEKNADMPAMPIELNGFGQYQPEAYTGLTKREHFCLAMGVPETGDRELDDIIRKGNKSGGGEVEPNWEPSNIDYDRGIHTNPDSEAWADFFMATFPNCGADPETMHVWFANAMMAVHDHITNTHHAPTPEGGE